METGAFTRRGLTRIDGLKDHETRIGTDFHGCSYGSHRRGSFVTRGAAALRPGRTDEDREP